MRTRGESVAVSSTAISHYQKQAQFSTTLNVDDAPACSIIIVVAPLGNVLRAQRPTMCIIITIILLLQNHRYYSYYIYINVYIIRHVTCKLFGIKQRDKIHFLSLLSATVPDLLYCTGTAHSVGMDSDVYNIQAHRIGERHTSSIAVIRE